jgi:hypothetical protein
MFSGCRSGIDSDVKIWAPTIEQENDLKCAKAQVERNIRERNFEAIDFQSEFSGDEMDEDSESAGSLPGLRSSSWNEDDSDSDASNSDCESAHGSDEAGDSSCEDASDESKSDDEMPDQRVSSLAETSGYSEVGPTTSPSPPPQVVRVRV